MWLSGRRFRNRIGRNGRAYFLYFAISRSIGTMFARMLRWVMTTPFGSAVAPEVKMISAVVSAVMSATRAAPVVAGRGRAFGCCRPQVRQPPHRPCASDRAGVHGVAGEHRPRVDDRGHAQQEVRRRAIVDRHEHDAFEQAPPERDDPFGAVLAPDRDRLPLRDALGAQPGREGARRPRRSARTCRTSCDSRRRRPRTRRGSSRDPRRSRGACAAASREL